MPTHRLPRWGTVPITCRGDTGHRVVFITKPLPCRWEKSLSRFTPRLPTVLPVLLHGLMLKVLISVFSNEMYNLFVLSVLGKINRMSLIAAFRSIL